MSTLPTVRNMISELIDQMGGDSYSLRQDRDTWIVPWGSTLGLAQLHPNEQEEGRSFVSAQFRIMKVPLPKALAFYRRLLSLNDSWAGLAAFAVNDENVVWLSAARQIENIDYSELRNLIFGTGNMADNHDDLLLHEFGHEYAIDT